jgi:cyclic pyranopterin phosphate synthase
LAKRKGGSKEAASSLPRFRKLSHVDTSGRAKMVNVSEKPATLRVATARGEVRMNAATLRLIIENKIAKGDVLAVAQVAGVLAVKRTDELIPMAHPIPLTAVDVQFALRRGTRRVAIEATASTVARTGVEMEALAAVAAAALAIYDMCKAVDRAMVIGRIRLVRKSGGRSGEYRRKGER